MKIYKIKETTLMKIARLFEKLKMSHWIETYPQSLTKCSFERISENGYYAFSIPLRTNADFIVIPEKYQVDKNNVFIVHSDMVNIKWKTKQIEIK